MSNELGRLTQGDDHGVKFTDCTHFIFKQQVHPKQKVTYTNFVCDYRYLKPEPWRVQLAVDGDKVDHFKDAGSPTTTLLEKRIFVNTVIYDSPKGARFIPLDLQDFFLCSTMPICWLSSHHWHCWYVQAFHLTYCFGLCVDDFGVT